MIAREPVMGQLLNSNLPDETIESYEERAKAKGHSREMPLPFHWTRFANASNERVWRST